MCLRSTAAKGADAVATAIVIEEVAREACVSSSAHSPRSNKLGSMGILLAGSEELRRRYLPELASGEAMFSYAPPEPGAGSDAASIMNAGHSRL